jgi:hypothetical protein
MTDNEKTPLHEVFIRASSSDITLQIGDMAIRCTVITDPPTRWPYSVTVLNAAGRTVAESSGDTPQAAIAGHHPGFRRGIHASLRQLASMRPEFDSADGGQLRYS